MKSFIIPETNDRWMKASEDTTIEALNSIFLELDLSLTAQSTTLPGKEFDWKVDRFYGDIFVEDTEEDKIILLIDVKYSSGGKSIYISDNSLRDFGTKSKNITALYFVTQKDVSQGKFITHDHFIKNSYESIGAQSGHTGRRADFNNLQGPTIEELVKQLS